MGTTLHGKSSADQVGNIFSVAIIASGTVSASSCGSIGMNLASGTKSRTGHGGSGVAKSTNVNVSSGAGEASGVDSDDVRSGAGLLTVAADIDESRVDAPLGCSVGDHRSGSGARAAFSRGSDTREHCAERGSK